MTDKRFLRYFDVLAFAVHLMLSRQIISQCFLENYAESLHCYILVCALSSSCLATWCRWYVSWHAISDAVQPCNGMSVNHAIYLNSFEMFTNQFFFSMCIKYANLLCAFCSQCQHFHNQHFRSLHFLSKPNHLTPLMLKDHLGNLQR